MSSTRKKTFAFAPVAILTVLPLGLGAILTHNEWAQGKRMCQRMHTATVLERDMECRRIPGDTAGTYSCRTNTTSSGAVLSYELRWLDRISVCTIGW